MSKWKMMAPPILVPHVVPEAQYQLQLETIGRILYRAFKELPPNVLDELDKYCQRCGHQLVKPGNK